MAEHRCQVLHLAGHCFLIVKSCIHRGDIMLSSFLLIKSCIHREDIMLISVLIISSWIQKGTSVFQCYVIVDIMFNSFLIAISCRGDFI